MSKINSRTKGASGERQACRAFEEAFELPHGCLCRNVADQARGGKGGDILGVPGVHFEVKWCKVIHIKRWRRQVEADCAPGDIAVIIYRNDGDTEWCVDYRLKDSVELTRRVLAVKGKPLFPSEQRIYGNQRLADEDARLREAHRKEAET